MTEGTEKGKDGEWKEFLKFQIFTPNTVHPGHCYPETCVFIQSIQIGQESEEEMERTLNL